MLIFSTNGFAKPLDPSESLAPVESLSNTITNVVAPVLIGVLNTADDVVSLLTDIVQGIADVVAGVIADIEIVVIQAGGELSPDVIATILAIIEKGESDIEILKTEFEKIKETLAGNRELLDQVQGPINEADQQIAGNLDSLEMMVALFNAVPTLTNNVYNNSIVSYTSGSGSRSSNYWEHRLNSIPT